MTGKNAVFGSSTPSSPGVPQQNFVFNLTDPSVANLGIFVVPGDVVLFETASGSLTDQSTWSDVVHFEDLPGVSGSTAAVFPDLDPGIVLPPGFALSANAVGIHEDLVKNFTVYTVGTPAAATYNIFSDCSGPGCEILEPGENVPEPATAGLVASGLLAAIRLRRRITGA